MKKGEVTALTVLDLSVVFATIDHATLTDRLPGMEYIARLKFGFLLIRKLGTNP